MNEKRSPTRRQSQRPGLSCLVQSHESRQSLPWLIFDVRQSMKTIRGIFGIACVLTAGCVSTTPPEVRQEMKALVGRRATLVVEVTALNHNGDRLVLPSDAKGLDHSRKEGRIIGVYPAGSTVVFKRVKGTTHVYGRYHYVEADILSGVEIIGRDLLFSAQELPPHSQIIKLIE